MADTTQAAPGELETIRSFVNTNDIDEKIDHITTPKLLRDWLAKRGLDPGSRLSSSDHRRAIELREGLRALLIANGGEPLAEQPVQALNRAIRDAQLAVRFGRDGAAELAPTGGGIDHALGELMGIILRSMAAGTWPRLKVCRDETCAWAFYDESKNRSGQWCSMAVCGNRAKVRSYRRRHRAGATKRSG